MKNKKYHTVGTFLKYHTVGTFVYKSKMRDTIYLLMSLEGHLHVAVGNDILTPSTDLFNYLFIVNICKPLMFPGTQR